MAAGVMVRGWWGELEGGVENNKGHSCPELGVKRGSTFNPSDPSTAGYIMSQL